MSGIKDYYLEDRKEDKRELRLTKEAVKKAYEIFPKVIKEKRWPYELLDNNLITIPFKRNSSDLSYSTSTNAMILFSLLVSSGLIDKDCPLVSNISLLDPISFNDHKENYIEVWEELLKRVENEPEKGGSQNKVTYSSTFGINDPFTLTWLLEISTSKVFADYQSPDVTKKIVAAALDRLSFISKNEKEQNTNQCCSQKEAVQNLSPKWLIFEEDRQEYSIDHTFIALRFVQLGKAVSRSGLTFKFSRWLNDYFESRLHEQLSRYEIRDGDFDAAELVFALEGALQLNSSSISSALIERFFNVITQSQKKNPYWRPVKPIVANPQGGVLFPLSVETACSLLRSCSLIEKYYQDESFFSNNVELFRRYSEWLRSRITAGKIQTEEDGEWHDFHGWHSEHVHSHQGIHVWETSNVIMYLQLYGAMLEKHIAKKSLQSANLTKVVIHQKEERRNDPLSASYDAFQPYRYAKENIIGPRLESYTHSKSKKMSYSALLYGPPGTGKTDFAEEICRKLHWPLITITPSDFIHGGESEVEARAKKIFDVLEDQFEVVILFDEIDRMILDRSAKAYNNQSDIFQFMTPSMLIKLRNLRKKKRSVFIVATNYKERIDPAAIRAGRIDKHLLMPPPDRKRRVQFFQEKFESLDLKESIEGKLKDVLKMTSLCTFTELNTFFDDVEDQIDTDEKTADKLIEGLKKYVSDGLINSEIRLASYESRFFSKNYSEVPLVEFLVLVYMRCEEELINEEEEKLINKVFMRFLNLEKVKSKTINKKKQKIKEEVKKRIFDDAISSMISEKCAKIFK